MQWFESATISKHLFRITTPFGVCTYLIIGSDKALLIDTGYGIGSLKDFISGMTDLPVQVLITHAHADHVGGAVEFQTVYLSKKDWELIPTHTDPVYRLHFANRKMEISETDLLPAKAGEYLDLSDGMVFDLGGVTVRTIAVPGHTKGSMALLIEQEHSLILGDAAGENTMLIFPESTCISDYQSGLIRLNNMLAMLPPQKFLRFHGSYESDSRLISDLIALCGQILRNEDAKIPVTAMGYPAFLAKAQTDVTIRGNILYKQSDTPNNH